MFSRTFTSLWDLISGRGAVSFSSLAISPAPYPSDCGGGGCETAPEEEANSFKYSLKTGVVKKLKLRSILAGYIFHFFKNETSETLCNGIVVETERVKHISCHVPKHLKPISDNQFGYYLAGLIDGDGHFDKSQQLVICFSSPDAFLAYYLKERLGYGSVKKVKDKNAYIFRISKKDGILTVLNLINNKLRIEHSFNQVVNNVLNKDKYKDININFTMDFSNDFNNHWLAGFADADASFQIKIIERNTGQKPEVRLNFQLDQKTNFILIKIKDFFGGNIGYRKPLDTYYYGSTSFGSAKKVIHYFDKFHLQSKKHISFLRWRKVYRLIQDKEHLTEKGLVKIRRIKDMINCHENNTTIQDKVQSKN